MYLGETHSRCWVSNSAKLQYGGAEGVRQRPPMLLACSQVEQEKHAFNPGLLRKHPDKQMTHCEPTLRVV